MILLAHTPIDIIYFENFKILFLAIEATWEGDLMSGVALVASEHPDLDAGIPEIADTLFDTVL